MGYTGRYGIKNMEKETTAAHYDSETGNIFFNAKMLKSGQLDNFYNLMSIIQHEADPDFGHKGEDENIKYTFLMHADVYLQQSSTKEFSKTTEDFRTSIGLEFANRIWNAVIRNEIQIHEIEKHFKIFNDKNIGKVKLDFDRTGMTQIDIRVSVNDKWRETVPARKIENPKD